MWRIAAAIGLLFASLAACGGSNLSPAEQATVTAVSAKATFDALPDAVKHATQTAVMEKIFRDLDKTPTP